MTLEIGDYCRSGRQCVRITGRDGDRYTVAPVQPPRKLRVPLFGSDPVPFGRRGDVLAALPVDVPRACLAWVEANPRDPFGGDYLYRFAAPLALVVAREGSGERKYSPALPWSDVLAAARNGAEDGAQ